MRRVHYAGAGQLGPHFAGQVRDGPTRFAIPTNVRSSTPLLVTEVVSGIFYGYLKSINTITRNISH